MSFAKPETKDSFDDKPKRKPCSRCFTLSEHEDLMKYGSFCKLCYEVYCHDVPAYPKELKQYFGDPKAWAKRIMDKHSAGIDVLPIALKFAKEALKL